MGRRKHGTYKHFRPKLPLEPRSQECTKVTGALASHPQKGNVMTTLERRNTLGRYLAMSSGQITIGLQRAAERGRRKLVLLAICNAALANISSAVGYFVIVPYETAVQPLSESLKSSLCLFSFLHCLLLIYYWDLTAKYAESVRRLISPMSQARRSLRNSPAALAACGCEVVLSLATLYPVLHLDTKTEVFGTTVELTFNEMMYIVVLLRNYYVVRVLYWLSPFSTIRTFIFAKMTYTEYNAGFLMRCYLTEYGFLLVAGAYVMIVLVPGLIEYVFEHEIPIDGLRTVWNDFWVVSYTQMTIGYGEMTPATFPGQLFLIIICLFGSFTLGLLNNISGNKTHMTLQECNLYSEMLYTKYKRQYCAEAVVLVQRWWRLMEMRMTKKRSAETITQFYTGLREYRSVLVVCQKVKDTRFERQISAFDDSIHSQFRPLSEYLSPIHDAHSLMLEVVRSEYRIKNACWSIYKLTHRHRFRRSGKPHVEICTDEKLLSSDDESSRASVRSKKPHIEHRGLAKAKAAAYQNVIGRLIKEDAWPTSTSDLERRVT